MKSLYAVLLALLAAPAFAQADADAIAHAKAIVANKLKDPESAQFKDLVQRPPSEPGKSAVVCGWVNAKNSYGGYVGFKPFLVVGETSIVRDEASAGAFNNRGIFASMWSSCIPESGESFGTTLVALPNLNADKRCAKLSKSLGRPLEYDCPKLEADARDWLANHPTSTWIATRCETEMRRADSYSTGKSCVVEAEADIVFSRGPRAEAAAGASP